MLLKVNDESAQKTLVLQYEQKLAQVQAKYMNELEDSIGRNNELD